MTGHIFIITGFSGAGKSSVLRALEDLGFYCVDNLPVSLTTSFFNYIQQPDMIGKKIALGIDIRAGQDMQQLVNDIVAWRASSGYSVKIIFLTASSDVLIKRFQETRRKHPLGNVLDLADALEKEKQLLSPLSVNADLLIDTDQFNIHELRTFVGNVFAADGKPRMIVRLMSFGFKYGIPHESNFVYDIRSLPNPYFIPELKILDGTELAIQGYLFSQPVVQEYWQKLNDFFTFSLDKSYQEGRSFIHVGVGCTGGRHRSVAFVQKLAELPLENVQFFVKHRDLHKDLL